MMAGHFIYILLYVFLFPVDSLAAPADSSVSLRDSIVQVTDSVVREAPVSLERSFAQADSLRKSYEFRKAAALCEEALSAAGPDDSLIVSAIGNLLRQCENGAGMSDFVYEPQVVDSKVVAREDFVLWFPFDEGLWHPLSCASDSVASGPYPLKAMLPDSSYVCLSSPLPEEKSLRFALEQADSLMLPDSVKVLPVLSQDGRTLYFSSTGLYGMGGYDLYKSEFDESSGEWGTPVNLGFPFSSPFNDYLLLNTDDGLHTVFASDRDCPADSVRIYVLNFDALPVRKPLESIEELRRIMELEKPSRIVDSPAAKPEGESAVPENADTRRYMQKMQEVKALRDSIYACSKILDQERVRYAMSDDEEERLSLTGNILRREAVMPVLQDSLTRAREELQLIEMEFLFNGIVVDMDYAPQKPEEDGGGEERGFPFARRQSGESVIFTEKSEN